MKFSSQVLLFSFLLILELICTANKSLAWDGIDPEKNSMIEIGKGNLVSEGLVIEFYDGGDLHMGKVIAENDIAGGTELLVEDFNEDHRERTLIMRESSGN